MDIAASGSLTQLMLLLQKSMIIGAINILPNAIWLLMALGTIDLALSLISNSAIGNEDPLLIITRSFLKYSFWGWLTNNWTTNMNLTKQWFDMFQYFGIKMAGGELNGVNDPSAIAEHGIYLSLKLLNGILSISSAAGVMGNIALILIKIIFSIVIIACFFWMALQLFLTCLEFYLTSALTVVLIPFGVNKHTSFIGEKAIGAVVSFSIKVMVLQFILCIVTPIAKSWAQIDVLNNDLSPVIRSLFSCLALAFITWKVPQYIQGLLSGSPSLHTGDAVGGARAVAGAAGSVVSGGVGGAVGAVAGGMRIAGYSQAAINSPGGRNNDGSVNWGGSASNMATMMRASMPDQAAQMEGRALFSRGTSLAKESSQRKQAQSQTTSDL